MSASIAIQVPTSPKPPACLIGTLLTLEQQNYRISSHSISSQGEFRRGLVLDLGAPPPGRSEARRRCVWPRPSPVVDERSCPRSRHEITCPCARRPSGS